jgi:hypothetical protein
VTTLLSTSLLLVGMLLAFLLLLGQHTALHDLTLLLLLLLLLLALPLT